MGITGISREPLEKGYLAMGLGKSLKSVATVGIVAYVKLKTAPHGTVIPVSIGGRDLVLRARTTDLSVAMDSLFEEYEPLAGLLPADFDGLIVDAGAYIGTASIRLSELYPRATVIAIEPSSRNYALLERNTKSYAAIKLEKAALSWEAGKSVALFDPDQREWGFTIVPNQGTAASQKPQEEIWTVSLAQISHRYGKPISMLKLDREGAEKDLFHYADDTLKSVNVIFVELHERMLSGCEEAFRIFSQLRKVTKGKGEKYLAIHES
jgi:FkbM family methyltransferase